MWLPDPFALVIAIGVGLAAYAIYRMCTYPEPDSDLFPDPPQRPSLEDEARRRQF